MRVPSRISLASLNCRGLKKILTPSGNSFARHIRSLKYDIIALQETHASSLLLQSRFDQCLQVSSSTWTQHCGLLSFNPMLNIIPLWSSIDGRLLAAQVSHISGLYNPINIFVIYVPAQHRERIEFLRSFPTTMPFDQLLTSRSILLGGFNHNIHTRSPSPSLAQ